ncbi:lytic transglycosylase domain-containing protein [Xanthomonas campestris]|jgi:type IV secretion system protein VirB1|uniref:lytic transglycosylase domain-containing protein n=1 Tax=Xanthomonas campestris TaxID=339 RepID=UPI000E32AFE5|nr:lytic transglycosylase domain-containing protein [Xanthomonas campestris pv. campestris]
MLPGIEMAACSDMAVPMSVMQHVVNVESSSNPYAIGVVGGRLVRQPKTMGEALATVKMLEEKGYNFSVGLAQVNRYNLTKYGLSSYERAFHQCSNLQAGSKILAECYSRSGNDWGKSFSCYYSGNFVTGYRHGYVQKIYASIQGQRGAEAAAPIAVVSNGHLPKPRQVQAPQNMQIERRIVDQGTVERVQGMAQRAQLVQQRNGDPAMVIAPASVSDYARGALVRTADATLATVMTNALTKRAGPAQGEASGDTKLQLDREPSAAGGSADSSGPVLVRPWGEKDRAMRPAGQQNLSTAPTAPIAPNVDTAFVF